MDPSTVPYAYQQVNNYNIIIILVYANSVYLYDAPTGNYDSSNSRKQDG